jgi:hypothetical protein
VEDRRNAHKLLFKEARGRRTGKSGGRNAQRLTACLITLMAIEVTLDSIRLEINHDEQVELQFNKLETIGVACPSAF